MESILHIVLSILAGRTANITPKPMPKIVIADPKHHRRRWIRAGSDGTKGCTSNLAREGEEAGSESNRRIGNRIVTLVWYLSERLCLHLGLVHQRMYRSQVSYTPSNVEVRRGVKRPLPHTLEKSRVISTSLAGDFLEQVGHAWA